MENENLNSTNEQLLKCSNCGYELIFKPNSNTLACNSCGTENKIEFNYKNISSESFVNQIQFSKEDEEKEEVEIIHCNSCGAEVIFEDNMVIGNCKFCASHLNLSDKIYKHRIKPKGIIPFVVDEKSALLKLNQWLNHQWLAPKKYISNCRLPENLSGYYIPYWEFEADTYTYFEGEVDTRDNDGGGSVYTVDGKLSYRFENLLICASSSLPIKQVKDLEPWNLKALVNYDKRFLKGFMSEIYSKNLTDAFESSKELIENEISEYLHYVRQKNNQPRMSLQKLECDFRRVRFKHILLPIWTSSFNYNNRIYRFVINGQTGEVQGQRPYSKPKLFLFILSWIIALALFIGSIIFLEFIPAIIGVAISILIFNLLYIIAKKSFDLRGASKSILKTKSVK